LLGVILSTKLGVTTVLQDLPVEMQYILNTFAFLMNGVLVMWMAAGFSMLEAGMVRTKSVSSILLKNISLFSIACLAYWFFGYHLMYTDVASHGGLIGSFMPWSFGETPTSLEPGAYAPASDWFFQMVFVATAASIVSGTLAERIKIWPFLMFVGVLTAFIYPITGAWHWGGGWLSEMGFADFAGSTVVHSVGGWAALIGAIILGPRAGKYNKDGKVNPMPGSALPLATLGTFILWMGWFGFNGGSQLALGSVADATAMANIFVNTTLAAAAGVIAAIHYSSVVYKRIDLTMVLNGALAGLVAITAGPDTPTPLLTVFIGAVGGILASMAVPLLDKLKIDDVVGAIPVHLVAGIWGTMAVPLSNSDASYTVQAIGIAAYGGAVMAVSLIVWLALRYTVGIRAEGSAEHLGLDEAELKTAAYPEFAASTQTTEYQHPEVVPGH